MLECDNLHYHPTTTPSSLHSLLLQIFNLLSQKINVGDVVSLDITNGRCLYAFYPSHE